MAAGNVNVTLLGQLVVAGNITEAALGKLVAAGNIDAVMLGKLVASGSINAVTLGKLVTAGSINVTLLGQLVSTESIDAATLGKLIAAGSITEITLGKLVATGSIDAAMLGKLVAAGNINVTLLSQLVAAGSINAASLGKLIAAGNITEATLVRLVSTESINITLLGQLVAAGSIDVKTLNYIVKINAVSLQALAQLISMDALSQAKLQELINIGSIDISALNKLLFDNKIDVNTFNKILFSDIINFSELKKLIASGNIDLSVLNSMSTLSTINVAQISELLRSQRIDVQSLGVLVENKALTIQSFVKLIESNIISTSSIEEMIVNGTISYTTISQLPVITLSNYDFSKLAIQAKLYNQIINSMSATYSTTNNVFISEVDAPYRAYVWSRVQSMLDRSKSKSPIIDEWEKTLNGVSNINSIGEKFPLKGLPWKIVGEIDISSNQDVIDNQTKTLISLRQSGYNTELVVWYGEPMETTIATIRYVKKQNYRVVFSIGAFEAYRPSVKSSSMFDSIYRNLDSVNNIVTNAAKEADAFLPLWRLSSPSHWYYYGGAGGDEPLGLERNFEALYCYGKYLSDMAHSANAKLPIIGMAESGKANEVWRKTDDGCVGWLPDGISAVVLANFTNVDPSLATPPNLQPTIDGIKKKFPGIPIIIGPVFVPFSYYNHQGFFPGLRGKFNINWDSKKIAERRNLCIDYYLQKSDGIIIMGGDGFSPKDDNIVNLTK